MSVRRAAPAKNVQATSPTVAFGNGEATKGAAAEAAAVPSFESLSETEKACASLGVQPDDFKPIGWINSAHYENLKNANALDGDLARRIDAFSKVAAESAK